MFDSIPFGTIALIAVLVMALAILAAKFNLTVLVNVFLRAVFGGIAIYFINSWVATTGINIPVGLNQWTVATVGIFGLPGLLLLYGIRLFTFLT